ncbi:hypothetical protein [Bacteriovorax sp. Seq25_V]|uniref:hypothetical protein n=1 Tax=Bacteriovorax sp. Seq25_V TaxID=1201288 RepID=UPI00038A4006|nr:hypothetical protein [Bacteriovorax sp. Seq25_V]EQC46174.1 putative lipoprotein [Bacteriovorax sp. Seq25_V]
MKTNFLKAIFLVMMLVVTACVPSSPNTRKTANTGTDSSTETEEDDTTSVGPEQISWFSSSTLFTGVLAQNSNAVASFYLRGAALSDYIIKKNKQAQTFCLVANFNSATGLDKRQLRLRAYPFRILTSSEYALKIEVSRTADNSNFCGGDLVPTYNSSNDIVSYINESDSAFTYSELCTNCTKTFLSDSIKIFESTSGSIGSALPISKTTLNLSALSIKIDVSNNQTSDTNTCSLSACQAEGSDCCLEGQCVKDGALRPNPDSTLLNQALYDVSQSYSNFKKWPTVYFVCQENTTPPTDTDEDETDPLDQAAQDLAEMIKDYNCLQGDASQCDPDLTSVQQKVWKMCGCMMDPITNDPLDPRCPDYSLQVETDTSGTITKVSCLIPPLETEPTPFQNMTINVSTKSAPHRYFSAAGTNYDDLEDVPEFTQQEGTGFSYLDETNKVGPTTTSFNMNAVLGQMSLDLSDAYPAKAIDVDIDQTYIIIGNSGYYTPCIKCQTDSWYNVFSSHPEIASSHGLGFKNYTTKRYDYNYNTNNANYEDNIFGRACWLPPTMIPFTHKANTNVQTQRQNRLNAQAALFINGYQRDWYGFNKGALIASFDGVKWFAVGNGRRVQSTSTKLFLAVNAPFADLSQPTSYNVSVIQDLGGQTASDFDWDFELGLSDSKQNPGASCQYMHQCEVDSDCVTKLGWEYACADVTSVKTTWPKFDINGNEKANNQFDSVAIADLLVGGLSGNETKRCVYRGAGSICKINPTTLTSNNQKAFSCAPNFYCASLNAAAFNQELKRSPNDPTNILYGQGANVLGRPKDYIKANYSLTSTIRENILEGIKNAPETVSATDYGVCMPGRNTQGTTLLAQHNSRDSQLRTDYISQIGGCDPTSTTASRTQACPVFDTDGNLVRTATPNTTLTNAQNMCGGESLVSGTSVFSSIEKSTLDTVGLTITTPAVAANACFRRAGSVCHTDLDCSPSYLHEERAGTLGIESFGGTLAELNFWKEGLVCGQGDPSPILGIADLTSYQDYDMGNNRCCREIAKDFTMYTQYSGADSTKAPGYDAQNATLNINSSSYNPTSNGRYSRYEISPGTATPSVVIAASPGPANALSGPSNNDSQWKTINQTGSLTCCGGGFIRKFEDGTNDWTQRNRLRLSPENFACINYKERTYKEAFSTNAAVKKNWTSDYTSLCLYPQVDENGNHIGCIQENIVDVDGQLTFPKPTLFTPPATVLLSMSPGSDFDGNGTIDPGLMVKEGVPYPPQIMVADGTAYENTLTIFRNPTALDAGSVPTNANRVTIYFPTYMLNSSMIVNLTYKTYDEDGLVATYNTGDIFNDCTAAPLTPSICYGTATSGRTYMSMYVPAPDDSWLWGYADIEFSPNILAGAMNPGSQQYYEDRLSKFELIGIPQINYQAVSCNDSASSGDLDLIPGIFDEAEAGTTTFAELDTKLFQYKTSNSPISHSQIFSADNFRCCSKLGSTVADPTRCCSGFGSLNGTSGQYTCKLPSGANLHLYLNKYVSSESTFELSEDEKLEDTDFDSATGYPKYTDDVYSIISTFGKQHCSSGTVRSGGAFGHFPTQPGVVGNTEYNSIVDSVLDYDATTQAGYGAFMSGYRWNLHSYCE